jgi:hypothetical protein
LGKGTVQGALRESLVPNIHSRRKNRAKCGKTAGGQPNVKRALRDLT